MEKIAVTTTGGDAPGMNCVIRAVVRTSIYYGMEIFGIRRGFKGLYEDDIFKMSSRDVSGIINQGGTILKTKRFPEFSERKIREIAIKNLKKRKIEGLIVIGGDGSAKGAYSLYSDFNFPVVLIPASIDNDLYGTDYTVGFDTAVNTAVEAIDRIRDTATSHERVFIIEVMGREKGNLAVEIALACGAEIVLIPERKMEWNEIFDEIEKQEKRGKVSSLIIVAEGAGKASEIAKILQKRFPEREIRFSVLGYIQRGGKPTYFTRTIATKFGFEAVKMLKEGKYGYMVGIKGGNIVHIPLKEVVSGKKSPSFENLKLMEIMAI
ncbi:MAG: 6-phosphofructokinase [Candidatus Omnitrophota bacterium]|nr:MAG: 6-phosphofructokinase [Candidatus Omnitrophota bacterium]